VDLGVQFNLKGLEELLDENRKRNRRVIEIGSWRGYSTSIIMQHIFNEEGSHLFCIDHWQGSPSTEQPKEIELKKLNVYAIFLSNMFELGYATRITPIKMSSKQAASLFLDDYADLVFLDGDHIYPEVVQDIDIWLPKVRKGGILCGHDMECMYDVLPESLKQPFALEKECIMSKHVGVIKAVCERFTNIRLHPGNIWSVKKE
jgi:predicted O-methyltransferase YrrM